MDLNSLRDQVSNLTLYDLKAGVRKVQNAVMNYTEMEAKVREATNNEPWGASSSLMQEIASGTHNYQLLNEIMPLIYKRFTDKTAEEWRQIYKSLQLLEFLIKNGSERVIDDARSHLSLLRMLRQFHYIDQNGKDQGVNVRNRAQELAKLLNDVDAIRAERKKARANRNKFGGVEGGMGMSGGFSSGSRYGGFGSEDAGNGGSGYGGYAGEVYGDGGGFGGNQSGFSDTQRRGERFEEYDEGDDAAAATTRPRKPTNVRAASLNTIKRDRAESIKQQKQKEPEQDLFDFGDESTASTLKSNSKAPATSSSGMDDFGTLETVTGAGEDDFDDFQSASTPNVTAGAQRSVLSSFSPPPPKTSTTTSSTQFAAPKPVTAANAANFRDIFSTVSPAPSSTSSTGMAMAPVASTFSSAPLQPQAQPLQPSGGFIPTGPNYFTSVPTSLNTPSSNSFSAFSSAKPNSQPSYSSTSAASLGKPTAAPNKTSAGAGGDVFGSLWSTASATAGIQNKPTTPTSGPNLASMAKAKSEAGIWGTSSGGTNTGSRAGAVAPTPFTASTQGGGKPGAAASGSLGNGLDDLLG